MNSLDSALPKLRDEVVRGALLRLRKKSHSAPAGKREQILVEAASRAAIDDVCRVWAETGKWPKMNRALQKKYAPLIWDRLHFASVFGAWLQKYGFENKKSEAEITTWLLVNYWRACGAAAWKSSLRGSP